MKNNQYFRRGMSPHAVDREIEFKAPPSITAKKLRQLYRKNRVIKETANYGRVAIFCKGFVYIMNRQMTHIITVYSEERYMNRRDKKQESLLKNFKNYTFREKVLELFNK